MTIKEIVALIRKKKKGLGDKWKTHHTKVQKEFSEGYKYGIREVGWNPFKKK